MPDRGAPPSSVSQGRGTIGHPILGGVAVPLLAPHPDLRVAWESRGPWSPDRLVRVLVADASALPRIGLVASLEDVPGVAVVGAVGDLAGLLEAVRARRPDAVVADPAGLGDDPGEVVAAVRSAGSWSVVVVTAAAGDAALVAALHAGARGYVLEHRAPVLLGEAVAAVAAGGTFVDPALHGALVALALHGSRGSGRPFGLTVREQRVLALVARDLTNPEVARTLGVSVHTVKAHLRSAMRKVGAHDRIEAARIARRERLL